MLEKAGKRKCVSPWHDVVELRNMLPQFHIQATISHTQRMQPLRTPLVQILPARGETRRVLAEQPFTRQLLAQLHGTLTRTLRICCGLYQRSTSLSLRLNARAFGVASALLPVIVVIGKSANDIVGVAIA